MKLAGAFLILTMLLASIGLIHMPTSLSADAPATPVWMEECPVTSPTALRPDKGSDPFPADASLHYEDGLWVTIPGNGVTELAPSETIAFGALAGWRSDTVTWLRDEGVEGFILVSGKQLDAESELAPQTPLSPQRQYAREGFTQTGLAFPHPGCWEVTGSVGERSITWVVEVRFIDETPATPLP